MLILYIECVVPCEFIRDSVCTFLKSRLLSFCHCQCGSIRHLILRSELRKKRYLVNWRATIIQGHSRSLKSLPIESPVWFPISV